jgi:hypothetical protein
MTAFHASTLRPFDEGASGRGCGKLPSTGSILSEPAAPAGIAAPHLEQNCALSRFE